MRNRIGALSVLVGLCMAGGAWAYGRAVAPGRVAWHASYREALEASARSGKPVFLFLLLGKLDEEFC